MSNVVDFKSKTEVVDVDFQEINEATPEQDAVLQEAISKTQKDDEIVMPVVNQLLEIIKGNIEDEKIEFDLRHGFQSLAKSINYLATAICEDKEEFHNELKSAHKLVVDHVMPSLPQEDIQNFSMRRLLILAGTIVDYLYWRENLGDYVVANPNGEEAPQEETTTEE